MSDPPFDVSSYSRIEANGPPTALHEDIPRGFADSGFNPMQVVEPIPNMQSKALLQAADSIMDMLARARRQEAENQQVRFNMFSTEAERERLALVERAEAAERRADALQEDLERLKGEHTSMEDIGQDGMAMDVDCGLPDASTLVEMDDLGRTVFTQRWAALLSTLASEAGIGISSDPEAGTVCLPVSVLDPDLLSEELVRLLQDSSQVYKATRELERMTAEKERAEARLASIREAFRDIMEDSHSAQDDSARNDVAAVVLEKDSLERMGTGKHSGEAELACVQADKNSAEVAVTRLSSQLMAQISGSRTESDALVASCEPPEAEVSRLTGDSPPSSSRAECGRCAKREALLRRLQSRLETTTEELTEAKEILRTMRNDLQFARDENEWLQAEHSDFFHAEETFNRRIAKLEDEKQEIEDERNSVESTFEDQLEAVVKEYWGEVDESWFTKRLNKAYDARDRFKKEGEALKKKLEELFAEQQGLQSQLVELKRQNHSGAEQHLLLGQGWTGLLREREAMARERDAIKREREALAEGRDPLNDELKASASALEDARLEIAGLQHARDALREAFGAQRTEILHELERSVSWVPPPPAYPRPALSAIVPPPANGSSPFGALMRSALGAGP